MTMQLCVPLAFVSDPSPTSHALPHYKSPDMKHEPETCTFEDYQ